MDPNHSSTRGSQAWMRRSCETSPYQQRLYYTGHQQPPASLQQPVACATGTTITRTCQPRSPREELRPRQRQPRAPSSMAGSEFQCNGHGHRRRTPV
ncbi:Os01g0577450 [Oryza sativa Japonica Group]|uniref:Os01g0577450 protein n=1 Tax=Oryza sativa subsp. japonica TaxID=39947 RepID=A0A0P0V4D9_ORYSJ|nr:hypothetical protein EE612_003667 [Oryza sativa]BAS72836.1 Os01g0577450 [Oryza sativa Japonica Group]